MSDVELGPDAPVNDPGPLVACRWLSPQPVITGVPGAAEEAMGITRRQLIRYGDQIWLTAEQAADPNTPAEPWSEDWTEDPELAAVARSAAGVED
jgi:hypothetical protein